MFGRVAAVPLLVEIPEFAPKESQMRTTLSFRVVSRRRRVCQASSERGAQ
jgi:hypothetical protein